MIPNNIVIEIERAINRDEPTVVIPNNPKPAGVDE
jgi:hypothetical protein